MEQASDGLLLSLLFLILFLWHLKISFPGNIHFELPPPFLLLLPARLLIITPSTLTKELIFLYYGEKASGLHVCLLMNNEKLFTL